MLGLLALGSRLALPAGSFALSVLAKDVYLVTPLGLGISRDRQRWWIAGVSVAALLAWMTWLTDHPRRRLHRAGKPRPCPSWGSSTARRTGPTSTPRSWSISRFAWSSVVAGIVVGISRSTWLRWPILGWTGLALISSNWVWDFGNNAARAFAPLAVLDRPLLRPLAEAERRSASGRSHLRRSGAS